MSESPSSLTADMLAQYTYCPRRMHLMYVDERWGDNLYTDQGRSIHARTDAEDDLLPAPATDDGDPEPTVSRSVMLTDEVLGLTAKPDIVEAEGNVATPVEIKRGRVPPTLQHTYEPERVQLMAQTLLLRAHGFVCEQGVVYYASSRRRIQVPMDTDLEARTRHLIAEARVAAQHTTPPPPLTDSPKCVGCSLAGICLPDETNLLTGEEKKPTDIRRLYTARDDALPLYVQEQGARVGKSGDALVVEKGPAKLGQFPLKDVSQLALCGNVSISAQCLHLLCERGIPVVHLSMGHWFYGVTTGIGLRNAYDRAAQFAAAADDGRRLALARAFVRAKAQNQRTFLRRNTTADIEAPLDEMRRLIVRLDACADTDELMGVEGSIAAVYFANWGGLLTEGAARDAFSPTSRNRRPPKDPVNAMLSFGYALLAKETTVALLSEGLDPYWGFLHRPRHGRPALSLDLMEEFRPLIVDSAVLTAINTGNEQRRRPDPVCRSRRGGGREACAGNRLCRQSLATGTAFAGGLILVPPVFERSSDVKKPGPARRPLKTECFSVSGPAGLDPAGPFRHSFIRRSKTAC